MAIMITSIGLVSVATLFPLSILRSVKATQLTASTDVRYNAEAAIDMYPNMIANTITPAYSVANLGNSTAADPPLTQNYIIDPLGFAAISALNGGNGWTTGGAGPAYTNRFEHWFGNDLNGGTSPPSSSIPFVDTSVALGATTGYGVARYPMSWRPRAAGAGIPSPDLLNAHYLVTLPDSWLLQFDTVGGTLGTDANAPATSTQVTQITVSGLSYPTTTPPSPALRVVMFSIDGTTSQIRNVTAINNNTTLVWTEDYDGTGTYTVAKDLNNNGVLDHYPLPASFVSSGIGIVRLEAQDPRYTWLLTFRQPNPQTSPVSANVDVVVFFNRSLENIGVDEVLYEAYFALGSNQVTVIYPTGNNTVTNQPLKPFMKKGGFIFDANNAYWYRISNVVDNPLVAGTSTVTLEVPANAGNKGLVNPNTNNIIPSRAMFPRNIVDVFPIGSKP